MKRAKYAGHESRAKWVGSPEKQKVFWTDEEILHALQMTEEGKTRSEVASIMSMSQGRPLTKNSIIGLLNRINSAADKVRCECAKPENKDGGMPAGWWHR